MSSIKKLFLYLPLLLLPMLACIGCSSDDDEVYDDNLTGKWDLVEIKDGPEGRCEEGYVQRYSSGTVIIEIKDEGLHGRDLFEGIELTTLLSI